jgi:protein phosphatase
MLLCSDGLWSVLGDADLAQRLATQTVVRAVPDMLQAAVAIGGPTGDNATALAIMWQGSSVADAAPTTAAGMSSIISTEMLPEDQVNTTISRAVQHDAGAAPVDAFDDDEIERAIAEIRGAIEKSSQLLTPKD